MAEVSTPCGCMCFTPVSLCVCVCVLRSAAQLTCFLFFFFSPWGRHQYMYALPTHGGSYDVDGLRHASLSGFVCSLGVSMSDSAGPCKPTCKQGGCACLCVWLSCSTNRAAPSLSAFIPGCAATHQPHHQRAPTHRLLLLDVEGTRVGCCDFALLCRWCHLLPYHRPVAWLQWLMMMSLLL